MAPELIVCNGGNRRIAEIALATGWRYGSQLPATVYGPLWFADQNWRKPVRARYMRALAEYRPEMATVLDLERHEQLSDVLSWAEEAAQYTRRIILIPKAHGIIARLPRRIGGADVVLGYSVPTRYGGTTVWPGEFAGWPVHLLGGSPAAQMRAYVRMRADVISIDGNYARMKATRFCEYWQDGRWVPDGRETTWDAPYEAFRRSCENIAAAWRSI